MPVSDKRQPRYKRILLKLSGEALMGSENFGIDPKVLDRMVRRCHAKTEGTRCAISHGPGRT